MNQELIKEIYKITGLKCVSCISVKSGDNLRTHHVVTLENGLKYICKYLELSDERLAVYKSINSMSIGCFQKTSYISHVDGNKYIILADWIDGEPISVKELGISEDTIEFVRESARTIKSVHDKYHIGRVEVNVFDVHKLFQKNEKLIAPCYLNVLKNYVLSNLMLLNGRIKSVVHGDLHLNNILSVSNKMFFIDIDDCGYGDPYMDLVYASNLIKSTNEKELYYEFLMSYFSNKIPQEFWIIGNIYSLCKAFNIMRCEKTQTIGHKSIFSLDNFMEQHNFMENHIPLWFDRIEQEKKND